MALIKKKVPVKTSSATPKRRPAWIESYINPLDMKEVAVSNLSLERMGNDMTTWARDSNALTVCEFYVTKGINSSTWYRWLDKSPFLKDCYKLAKEIIGIRRTYKVTNREISGEMIRPTQGFYSHDWRSEQQEAAKLKIENNLLTPQVIEIQMMPATDVVPPLKKRSRG